ncbi:MAG: hypothetical protein K8I27_17065 [Planctomycetes bacterium]|nr:hypothetical protein [Planctomycetota bacterium]
MSELSPKQWAELNEKLEKELAATEALAGASAKTATKLILAATFLFLLAGALVFVFLDETFALLIAMPPALLFLVCVMYILRHHKVADLARQDADRIRRDIRQWKKKRPAES